MAPSSRLVLIPADSPMEYIRDWFLRTLWKRSSTLMNENSADARHVRFAPSEHEGGTHTRFYPRSPPPPYEAQDDCFEELQLDLAIAREGIWRLEWELLIVEAEYSGSSLAAEIACPQLLPPQLCSSLGACPHLGEISIFELQLDLLIAQERIRSLLWELSEYYTLRRQS
ncbi:hypothetical protein B0H13DRAFT_1850792 [Mycena leptocephala]|nr:hypothetical protein B0H13DRAFT_1850792 [Mycena leptocephala]